MMGGSIIGFGVTRGPEVAEELTAEEVDFFGVIADGVLGEGVVEVQEGTPPGFGDGHSGRRLLFSVNHAGQFNREGGKGLVRHYL
jgi:hypothetical protein